MKRQPLLVNGKPFTRGDCKDGPRPCPHKTCVHNLGFEIRLNPIGNVATCTTYEGCEWSCSLDVADAGGATLEEIGLIWGITRERVRQIEATALRKIKSHPKYRQMSKKLRDAAEDWDARESLSVRSSYGTDSYGPARQPMEVRRER